MRTITRRYAPLKLWEVGSVVGVSVAGPGITILLILLLAYDRPQLGVTTVLLAILAIALIGLENPEIFFPEFYRPAWLSAD